MNILYIDHYAGSPKMGMEFRPYYLAREWVKMGHTVRIVAGDYSHLRQENPAVKEDFQSESIDGISYTWVKTGKYKGNGVARALTMFRFVGKLMIKARQLARNWKPDVVITSSTYPLDTFAGQKITKYAKARYIHEVHDMWPATLYEVGGMSKNNPFVIAMQIAEYSAYKHCEKCISLLPYTMDYMVKHGLESDKFINIQNGIVEEEWDNPEDISEEHKVFFSHHEGQFIVGYFGGHALSNALDNSLDIAKCFCDKDKDVIFVFVGEGVEKNKLIQRVNDEKINNAFFLPSVHKKAIPTLLQYFDCSFMTGIPSPLYRFGLCLNKMYDSMMAGIPIVCAFDAPDTLVKIYDCGFQCNSADIESVVNAIKQLKSLSIEERKRIGENGKNAVLKNYTYRRLAKKFLDSI